MSIDRKFEFHEEVLDLFNLLRSTWDEVDPKSNVTQYPAAYHETFLDMARAVTQAGYHRDDMPRESFPTAARTLKSGDRFVHEDSGLEGEIVMIEGPNAAVRYLISQDQINILPLASLHPQAE